MVQSPETEILLPVPGTSSQLNTGNKEHGTAESTSTVDSEEAGTAAPFAVQGLAGATNCGRDVWVCRLGYAFGDGSTVVLCAV